MNLDDKQKTAVRELGEAINSAVESSQRVKTALETIRNLGFEPHLTLKLDIGLSKIGSDNDESEEIKLELTEQDLQTLRGMKISIDDLN
jgi:alanine racemase